MSRWAQSQMSRYQQQLLAPSLDEQIGAAHGIRLLDELLLEMDWSEWEKQYACEGAGRPPIHPRLLAGCILYGLLKRIRSTRDLEEATRMRLDFRWFMDGTVVDHTTFCVFRKTFGSHIDGLFKQLNRRAATLKCATLEEIIIDGTRIRADSDRHGARTAEALEKRLVLLEKEIAEGLEQLAEPDTVGHAEVTREQLEAGLRKLDSQRNKLRQALDVAMQRDQIKQQTDGKGGHGVRVPVTDPDASIMPNKEGGYAPNYTPVVAVEPNGLIVGATLVDGNAEAAAVVPLMVQIGELNDRKTERLLVDGGFSTGENLEQLKADDIEVYAPAKAPDEKDNPVHRPDPSVPVPEAQRAGLPTRGKQLDRSAFIYDPQNDSYFCPMGRCLPLARTIKRKANNDKDVLVKEYVCKDCSDCPLSGACIKGKAKQRRISRDQYEPLREQLAQRMASPEAKTIYARRAPTGEGVFATIKGSMGIRRFSVRGKEKVFSEWLWVCTAYNLKKLIKQGLLSAKSRTPTNPCPSHDPQLPARHMITSIRVFLRVIVTQQQPDALAA